MDLKEYFITKSKELSVKLKTYSPNTRTLTAGKGKARKTQGVLASFDFDSFKIDISYTESGKLAYAQQTIWVNVKLDAEPGIPFSLYDVLAVTEPENFNCYTYTYVDSQELMKSCFEELRQLLERIVPKFKEYLESGVNKNNLIIRQKETINKYFGDDVLEAGEALGGQADRLIAVMLANFHRAQVESAVLGSQALFYGGKTEKALKRLRAAKSRSLYQDNLLAYLENGGKALEPSETAKKASADKGAVRHGGGVKGGLQLLGYTFLFAIPIGIFLCAIYYLIAKIYFRDSLFIYGLEENLLFPMFMGVIMALGLALKRMHKKGNSSSNSATAIHSPKSKAADNLIKYFIIAGETLALLGVMTCVFSTTAFYKNSFSHGEGDFPLRQSVCSYDSIDYFAIIDGYSWGDGKFTYDTHIAAKTKSGAVIDLYNSTYYNAESFKKHEVFFKEKGIEIKSFKTVEEMK